jgi:NitT/TauT family transport system ATP-binding protein
MGEVRLIDIGKRFRLEVDRKEQIVTALEGVNLTVADGEIVMLTGPSGCGKTTALRIVMGLERASTGRVLVAGRETHGCGHNRGMVFQHAELLPWLTARENVRFGLEMKGVRGSELDDTADHYLEMVGLTGSANRRPHQLSGGMKQRVGIARALAIDPDVLLMDEPFGALDAQTRETLQAQLLEIHARTRKTIVFVTHDLDEAVLLGDRVVVMGQGRIREIVDIPLPRPRIDVDAIRGDALFAQTRHRIWRSLHAGARDAHDVVFS